MKWREAPRLIFNPGITPWIDIGPMAVAIWSPAHNRGVREPHRAVLGSVAPPSVVIQVFVADRIFGNVAAGNRMIFAAVTFIAPGIKVIVSLQPLDVRVQLVRTREVATFTLMEIERLAAPGHAAFAVAHLDISRIAGLVDVYFVNPWAEDGEGQVGRIDLELLVALEAAYANAQGT